MKILEMKKTKKLLMTLVLLPLMALADTETVDGITWTYDSNGTRAVLGFNGVYRAVPSATVGAITIPSVLGGCPVTIIGNNAFKDCTGLTSVAIPSSVTDIMRGAFSGCTGLTSVTVPSGLTSIAMEAFYGCSGLRKFTIPSGVKSVGNSAFARSGLEEVAIPSGVTIIYPSAFSNCRGLMSVSIPPSVTSVGERLFENCTALKSVALSSGITKLEKRMFSGCSDLASMTIPTNVTSVGDYAFENCSHLTTVMIPSSVKALGQGAFEGCDGLSHLTIPSSVSSISSSAFRSCCALTEVVIPPGVETISYWAFGDCSRLKSVTIPLSVTSISGWAFKNCASLELVTIPISVNRIGDGAFEGCCSLESVLIPPSVTNIGNLAFSSCDALRTVYVNKGDAWRVKELLRLSGGLNVDSLTYAEVVDEEGESGGEVEGVQLWEGGPYWAECNVGASKPEEYGLYFWWGDTEGHTGGGSWFSEETCPTYGKSITELQSLGYVDSTGNLAPTHDAARVHLGDQWRMPTCAELDVLVSNCDTVWTTRNGVSGRLIKGRGTYSSKSIFLPAAGFGKDSGLYSLGLNGVCWSSTPNSDYSHTALSLYFASDDFRRYGNFARWSGRSVRPVREFATSIAFMIVFDANGGTCSTSSKSYVGGSTLGTLPTATRSGYAFDGWYTAASGGTKVTAAATVTGNMTLYARWMKNAVSHTITFNANGGLCSMSSKEYASGATLGSLPTATQSGYSFEGWYTSASGGTKVLVSTTVTGSMTLYAHWKIVVDKDKVQNEWYASYSDHAILSWVMVGGDRVYVDEVSFPYVFPSSGAVLNRTQGGYRVDLKGVLLKPGPWTSNVIDADGDLSIYLENENVIEGRVQLSGRGGVLDPLPSSHRLLIFGPGKLTILGESDGMNSAICAVDSVSIMAGATVSIYGERTGIETDDMLISGSMVGVYGASYRAIECNNLRILAGVFSMQTTHQGIYAKGDVVIDASIVNAFTPQICVYSGNFYASNSYLALAATSLDDSLSSHSVLLSTEVSFNQCVAKIIGFASIYECGSWMTRITDACGINANQVAFGDGDYYIGLKAKGFVGSEDDQYTTSGILADSFLMMGGNVRVCSPGISAISVARSIFMAGEMDVMSGMLEIQDKFDTTEMFKFDAGIVAGYTAAIGAGILDASTASVDFYTQVFLDALSNGLLENIEGKASSSITFGNGFYVQMGGTVLAKGSAHGILTYKYPAIINGGSCRAEFQLYEAGGHYYETSPVFVEGETVNQNLKCVEYAVSGASKYDKIARSWDGVLPSYYGTQSLYADEGGKLYFWVPESWVVTSVFMITFDAQGGDVAESTRTAKSGNAIDTLPTPTRSKYKFLGWYTAAEGGTKISSTTKVTADVTYYAHWQYDGQSRVDVKVTDGCANMGIVSGGKSAKGGTKVTLKATAKKGYVFAGWYRDAAGVDPVEGETDYRSPSYSYVVGEDDAMFYAKFIPVAEDWVSVWCQSADEYARGVEIEPLEIEVDSASLATVKVTGLPTGLKFTAKPLTLKATNNRAAVDLPANTIYGTPTKSGIYTATITATTAGKKSETYKVDFVVRDDGEYLVDVMGLDGADYPDNGSDAQHAIQWGKMSGYGVFKPNTTATLKATANRGYVFAGWFSEVACVCEGGEEDDGCVYTPAEGTVDYRSTSFPVKVGYEDVLYYARFVRAEDDDMLWANVEDAYYLNGPWSLKLGIESMSLPTVTVKGLPSGLKFNSKTLTISGTPTKPGTYPITLSLKNATIKTARTQGFTLYVANIESPYLSGVDYTNDAYVYHVGTSMEFDIGSCATGGYSVTGVSGLPSGLKFNKNTGLITGVPTKAGPKTVTITLKNGNLTSSATVTLNVDAIDTWAYGTFNGGGEDGVLTLTVGNTGKISGKWMTVDGTWTLSAKSYESYDDEEQGCYRSLVAAKCGTKTAHFWLDVCDGQADIYEYLPTLCGYGPLVATAKRNVWKEDCWESLAAQMKGVSFTLTDEVSLKVGAAGAVTATGRFVTGQNASGRDVVYSASCSTVLVPIGEDAFSLYLCFPKKDGKFDGMALQEVLEWNGSELAVGCAACRVGF